MVRNELAQTSNGDDVGGCLLALVGQSDLISSNCDGDL